MSLRPWLIACALVLAAQLQAHAQISPQAELATLRVPDNMEVSLYASEPLITNPSAIDIDTQGRVWVAEIQWYRAKAKQPPADKIKVLEDTDGDGKADKVTVFADGVFAPMSICVAGDKVYVATSPDLWVYEDKDHDLKADGPPKKLLTGFGGFNHDHGAHSLVLGPDHKWWMSHGDTGFNVTGTDGSKMAFKWGGMLRGELDGSQLEAYAVNFRNPYELSVSSFGESFCSDNDNDGNFSTRICWLLEGGNYGWFGAPPPKVPPGTPFGEHWHFRGHIPGFVPATLVTGFGSPAGMCYYEGDAFGADFKNQPLHCDPGPREVRAYRHEPYLSGKKATSKIFVSNEGDNYFRPDDICTAPDGSLYISDWYDGGVGGHNYNDPDHGRIFRLTPKGKKLERVGKPGPYQSMDDAIVALGNPNLATQYLARERLLAGKQESIPALIKLLDAKEPNVRARALWVLDRIGGQGRDVVIKQLKSDDADFRALAVRILARHAKENADAILSAASDKSLDVRREVLLALRNIDGPKAQETLVELASTYDGHDRYLLEAINIGAGTHKAELFAALEKAGQLSVDKIELAQVLDPQAAAAMIEKSLARAKLDEASRKSLLQHLGGTASPEAGRTVLRIAVSKDAPIELRRLAIKQLGANLGGTWKDLRTGDEFVQQIRPLLADEQLQPLVLGLVGDQALTQLAGDVLALATSEKAPAAARVQAIKVVAQLRSPDAAKSLAPALKSSDAEVRHAALSALVDLQYFPAIKSALTANDVPSKERAEVTTKLMSTTGGALVLLRMLDEHALSEAVAADVVARAENHPDANVRTFFEKYIPEAKRPKKLGQAVKQEEILAMKGHADRGQQIFMLSTAAQCKNCHRVQGAGVNVGPDLSQIGRKYERGALLDTILNPSKAIAPEFIAYLLQTSGGQVFAGLIVEKNDREVVLREANGNLVHVPAGEVEQLVKQEKSLMPELVLRDVTAQDAADLLAYLESLKQQTQPVTRFRIAGPFESRDKKGIERVYPPEKNLTSVDLGATFEGYDKHPCKWEVAEAAPIGSFLGIDQVKYATSHHVPAEGVTNYFLTFADSAADQDVTFQLGSDDDCKVWINGALVHTYHGDRPLGLNDQLKVHLKSGRNTIMIKVENHQGPGGVALTATSSGNIEFKTE